MLTIELAGDIETIAMRGNAIASLLGLTSSLEECTNEDIGLAVYALECYFSEILKTLESVETGPEFTNYR